jgi:hypothetical protein
MLLIIIINANLFAQELLMKKEKKSTPRRKSLSRLIIKMSIKLCHKNMFSFLFGGKVLASQMAIIKNLISDIQASTFSCAWQAARERSEVFRNVQQKKEKHLTQQMP